MLESEEILILESPTVADSGTSLIVLPRDIVEILNIEIDAVKINDVIYEVSINPTIECIFYKALVKL